MQKLYIKRFESYKKSLDNLLMAKNQDKNNIFVLSGTIMIFNLTFDISWKIIKEVLNDEFGIMDFPSGSPKETLKKAASVELIKSDIWLDMLDDRNNLSHDYDFVFAYEQYDKIIKKYIPVFEELKSKIENYIGNRY